MEKSIFECSDQEFRKRVVDAINTLIKRADRHNRMLRELDDNIVRLGQTTDDLESQVQALRDETDSLDDSINELNECFTD
jgi:predicted  nucleic acid-binding Zn-ribbon protein